LATHDLAVARWVQVRGAAHNDLLAHREVWEAMRQFLKHI